tara:strand:- start:818 stop:1666 length:849 start_codon:yes stop_codon:yes gene_type:complete
MLLHRNGSVGQEVKRIQRTLKIKIDGKFGPKTEEAVKSYQASNNLADDGVVGPATRASLGIDIYPGIDVSRWNGNVPWARIDQSQVQFVWVKASQGQDWYDKSREHNFVGCRAEGIPVGGYHFPSPHIGDSKDPKLEVQQFVRALGRIEDGDMLPVLDLEAGVKGDRAHNLQWALEFLEEFEKETGLRCIVYTAEWYKRSYLPKNLGTLTTYPLWVADYTKPFEEGGRYEPDGFCGWQEYSVWQWTGKGYVDGLDTTGVRRCDRNWLPGGPEAMRDLRVWSP